MVRNPLRAAAKRLRDRAPGVDRTRAREEARRAARRGARGEPGNREAAEPDPAERAGREAMVGAPVDATLHPFGPADTPAGPRLLEVMAGGGSEEVRAAQRDARGVDAIEQFAAAGGLDTNDAEPLLDADGPLDVDDSMVYGGER